MVVDVILVLLGLTGLVIGSYTDLRTREVPDWLNYGLITAGLGIRLIHAIIAADLWFFVFGIVGITFGFLFALLMYYTGQWGGGDAKMLIALGALFGSYSPVVFSPDLGAQIVALLAPNPIILQANVLFLPLLLLNILLLGALYGVSWLLVLAVKQFRAFVNEANRIAQTKPYNYARILVYTIVIGSIIIGVLQTDITTKFGFFFIGVAVLLLYVVTIVTKAVEKLCMIKDIPVSQLTEGEWIAADIYNKKEYICGPKDLGVSKEQISRLKQIGIKKVRIKVGIPFVPAFLFGFLFTVIIGNPLAFLMSF